MFWISVLLLKLATIAYKALEKVLDLNVIAFKIISNTASMLFNLKVMKLFFGGCEILYRT